jgi:predicted amidohydrolase
MSSLKIGLGQMLVEGGKLEENFARARVKVEEAAQNGCQILMLPECLDVGWTHPSSKEIAVPIPGTTSDVLCYEAKEHEIHVVAGITERYGNSIYNAAILISPEGKILHKHRKITTLGIEQHLRKPLILAW